MCGIAGLFAKDQAVERELGAHLAHMLDILADRGPDSAGFAIYGDPVGPGEVKVSLRSRQDTAPDWASLGGEILESSDRHAVVVLPEDAAEALRTEHSEMLVLATGSSIELFKEVGLPSQVAETYGLAQRSGSHALGHTRMATESRVTMEGSHPFSTGHDLCLVHNGSLSNHNRLRAELRYEGIVFGTENDSEVAAGYLTWRMREGASLEEALTGCLRDLDGFYTFAVGTLHGFAVLRDPIACKPAVLAETDDWVAMASEYRAIAGLPGAADAQVWEPEPGRVYVWEREVVA